MIADAVPTSLDMTSWLCFVHGLYAGDPPVYWPERRYPWGTAEAFNREHSDLLSLR
jgi:hypothetical protein